MDRVSAVQAAALVKPGDRVFVAGCCGEPGSILDIVAARPSLWRDVRLIGAFIPGVNERDFSACGIDTTVESIFVTPGLKPGRTRGKVDLLPISYTSLWERLARPGYVDIAFAQVPPPRPDGTTSFGIAADFAPAVEKAGSRLVGLVNPAMPDPVDGPRVPADRFEALLEANTPLPEYHSGEPDAAIIEIGRRIAGLLKEGDTLQLGLGKVQTAVLSSLCERRGLRFHGGMISTPIIECLRAGTFDHVTTGVALGDAGFYRSIERLSDIAFRPVGTTHDLMELAGIPRLVSVNSVLEVDLFGQANAEMVGGRQVSGQGGLVDFVRGARRSHGGRSILALPSRTGRGRASRIVPCLGAGTPVTVARADTDIVVTEHGVAELRDLDVEERARRLVSIAHPDFREELERAWSLLAAGTRG